MPVQARGIIVAVFIAQGILAVRLQTSLGRQERLDALGFSARHACAAPDPGTGGPRAEAHKRDYH
jgi:hypothetical protein